MVSLFAKKSLFVFDTKSNQKNQDNKDAYPLPAGSSRFFRCFSASHFHITQKAKPSFPPLRWPALVVRVLRFFYSSFKSNSMFFVNREASGENGQNDGGLVWLQGIRKFCRSAEARSGRSRAKDSSPGSVRFAG